MEKITGVNIDFDVPSVVEDENKLVLTKDEIKKITESYGLIPSSIFVENKKKDKYIIVSFLATGFLNENQKRDFRNEVVKFLKKLFFMDEFLGKFEIGNNATQCAL